MSANTGAPSASPPKPWKRRRFGAYFGRECTTCENLNSQHSGRCNKRLLYFSGWIGWLTWKFQVGLP